MEALYTYLVKLSISLSLVYLFYVVFLRRLTFYRWNRYYFILATLLACLLPFIDIGNRLQGSELDGTNWVTMIPTVETAAKTISGVQPEVASERSDTKWGITESFLLLSLSGVLVMLMRLGLQMVSFFKLKKSAVLIGDEGARLYQVDQNIMPFSFAGSIFINRRRHDESELKEIIRHEHVHVREKHSLDVLWSEMLCVINWYNPFVWLIRRDVRQNLEFIADEKVLNAGIDRKSYQYLLLKVTGISIVGIANNFNFSSLKKRIAMMNKTKSARLQLARFLVILPLIAFTLLAFRSTQQVAQQNRVIISYAGIVSNELQQPMIGVKLTDSISGLSSVTDNRGYFKIDIPAAGDRVDFVISILVPGQQVAVRSNTGIRTPATKSRGLVHLFQLKKSDLNPSGFSLHDHTVSHESADVGYETISRYLISSRQSGDIKKQLDAMRGTSLKPIWMMNNLPYAVIQNGWAWFDKDEFKPGDQFKVVVNDSIMMTMERANEIYTINDFSGIGASSADYAFKTFGIRQCILRLFTQEYVDREKFSTPARPKKLIQL